MLVNVISFKKWRIDKMEMNEKQKKIVKALGNTPLGELPSIMFPMLDDWISANPEEHKKFAEEKFGWKKI